MDKDTCVMCRKKINLFENESYEYDEEEGVWCIGCYQIESDTGEIN